MRRRSVSRADFATFLEPMYPDGRHDSGGMAGPLLHPGSLMNTSIGGTAQGMRRILVRPDPRATRVYLHLACGEHLELEPVAGLP